MTLATVVALLHAAGRMSTARMEGAKRKRLAVLVAMAALMRLPLG